MKNLVRSLLYTFLLLLGHCTTFAQTGFYVHAGANLSRFYSPQTTFDPILGGQAGILADVQVSDHFSILSALQWAAKGTVGKLEIRDANGVMTDTYRPSWRLHYLELPVVAAYKVKAGKTTSLLFGLGGYAALGIAGTIGWDGIMDDQRVHFTTKKSSRADGYNRYDYGVHAVTGVQFNKLMVLIQYSHGIPENYISASPNRIKSNNRTLGMSVAYRLGTI